MAHVRDRLRLVHHQQQTAAEAAAASLGTTASSFPLQLVEDPYLNSLFRLLYGICKTRGYKSIIKLFPHEVADLEPALRCLLSQVRLEEEECGITTRTKCCGI